jgi:hypothetical protein
MQQEELPMKDITPKKAKAKPDVLPLEEGMVRKGGRNRGPSQIKDRPSPPAPINKSQEVAVHQPSAAPAAPKSVLAIIAEAASNPAVNPENMRALLDMQKEIVAEERKQAFDAAFIALQAELPVINKDGKIEIRKDGKLLQSTPYATFETIMDVVQPLLTKHGFGLSFETKAAGEKLLVIGHLIGHGHERHTEFPLPAEASGSKNNVQGWGSTEKYGMRYATIALLNIRSRALQDADTDGFPGDFKRSKGGGLAEAPPKQETLTASEAKSLREKMDECGVDVAKFCGHFGLTKVADLPRELLPTARKECDDFRARREAAKRHG